MLIQDKLFFIAIIPPQEICEEVTGFKEDFYTGTEKFRRF